MIKNQNIVLVINDIAISTTINDKLGVFYNINSFKKISNALDSIYNSLPDLIITDFSSDATEISKIISEVKK
ncbi:MAG TPA: hypothetical protein HPP56_01800, partial [Nitrospirae bacterium]|nr:hypothetical protein [Nitrospirota bacterium]